MRRQRFALGDRVTASAVVVKNSSAVGLGRTSRFVIWGGLTPTQRATLDHTRQEGPTA